MITHFKIYLTIAYHNKMKYTIIKSLNVYLYNKPKKKKGLYIVKHSNLGKKMIHFPQITKTLKKTEALLLLLSDLHKTFLYSITQL